MIDEYDEIEVITNSGSIKGIVMPNSTYKILFIKLKSGYNIGIDRKNIKRINMIKKSKRISKEKSIKHKKYKENLPVISILHTGGTLASKVSYETGGVIARFTPEDLIEMFPELENIANINSYFISNMFSEDIRFKHYEIIAKEVEKHIKKGVDGIIIGHGTDMMHYTSAALSFILDNLSIPVILVGSQRSSDRGSTDAAMNLICAAEFIAKTDFSGVAICMHETTDDESCVILPACKSRKLHSSRRDAFKVVNYSIIARVNYKTRSIEFIKKDYIKRDKKRKLILKPKMEEKIGLIKIHTNMNENQFKIFKGYKGLIIEGTGLGHMPINKVDKYTNVNLKIFKIIKDLIKSGVIVVMCTQTIFGRVNLNVYSTGRNLQSIGVISGEDMLAETAFVKLAWLLGNYKKEDVKKMVNKNLRGEINERILTNQFL